MSNQQSNDKSNTPLTGDTSSPLGGNATPNPSSKMNYAALLQNNTAISAQAHYNSLAATAATARQQLYAQAQHHTGRILAEEAGIPTAAVRQEENTIGGVPVPPMKAGTPTKLRIEAAALHAAEAAVPYGSAGIKRAAASTTGSNTSSSEQAKKKLKAVIKPAAASRSNTASAIHQPIQPSPNPPISMSDFPEHSSTATAMSAHQLQTVNGKLPLPPQAKGTKSETTTELMQKQQSRDRNREHARSTRLRKKAYVNKLKELLDALHVERSEDDRKRRVAVQKLAEIQELRRKVVKTFFGYHASCERNTTKWRMILEEDFCLKQPVTPYRSFRRCEIEKGSRITKGIEGLAGDAASMAVMIDTIGSRNLRWLSRKRDYFLSRNNNTTKLDRVGQIRTNAANAAAAAAASGTRGSGSRASMPHSIEQNSRLQHAISSLSSSSESGHGSSGEDLRKVESMSRRNKKQSPSKHRSTVAVKKVSCSGSSNQLSSSSNDTRQKPEQQQKEEQEQQQGQSNDYHDYHAPSLLDPLPESGDSLASDNCVVGKHMLRTDSSSEDEDSNPKTSTKRQKIELSKPPEAAAEPSKSVTSLPPNIAQKGISHSVKGIQSSASLPNGHAQLARAPATTLPPFSGIGKKSDRHVGVRSGSSSSSSVEPTNNNSSAPAARHYNANNRREQQNDESSAAARYLHAIDNDTTSSSSMEKPVWTKAYYHLNEDDMILTDNVLMCPFIFRSCDAIPCGALSECVMPGMLRACFSPTNKLSNVEMIFDAMGFCQQLERASGNDSMAQIIPNSLEMALSPVSNDARVITMSKAPYPIVSVNESWTNVTGYTQVDVEGKDLSILNGRETIDKNRDMESVVKGQPTCSVNVHYDVNGRDFFSFVCSYPITNLNNEVTHLLHVFQELPSLDTYSSSSHVPGITIH